MDDIKQYYMTTTARALRNNANKLRYDLIPAKANEEYAKVWTVGAAKYEPRNWEKGMPYTEVIASAMRHLEAIRLGEDIDPEDGLLHAAHLMCNAAMLAEFHYTHPEFDDRVKYDKEPKQETHICKYCKAETSQSDDECYAKPKAEYTKENSAKWQQKRMYSEEDMEKCWNASYIDAIALDDINYKPLFFEDFMEQLKKK